MSRVHVDESGCWIWTGRRRVGYGEFDIRGEERPQYISRKAHRVSYEMFVGPIPEGHELHHTCEVRACVNPAHLAPLTRDQHVKTGALSRMYAMRRSRDKCKHGHPYGDNPPVRGGGRVCATCARNASRRSYERSLSSLR